MQSDLYMFLSGATALATAAIALIFWRCWVRSRDQLFVAFTTAFVLFTISRVTSTWLQDDDFAPWTYGVRLAGFVVLLFGILAKNRSA